MPYITQKDRELLKDLPAINPGQLNYLITKLLNEYIQVNGLNYQKINDVLGALEGSKLEFYRRVAVPYENQKLAMNNDVYTTNREEE